MADDAVLAREWRAATRAVFTSYLASRYEAREIVRGTRTSTYLIVRRRD
jgi:predicted GNAT superfamily acetyltransferase